MKSERPALSFVLDETVNGVEITPETISLSRFNEFNQQVAEFIAGSQRLKLDDVRLRIESGSYKITALLTMGLLASIEPDLRLLRREDRLGEVDPKRAEVLRQWQRQAKADPGLRYAIVPHGMHAEPVTLDVQTDFRVGDVVPWVKAEKYLFGTVENMGGASKANVHVRLEDTGDLVIIGTDQDFLRGQQENRLYRKVLVRVEAEEHTKTGQLKNLRLISFEDYQPQYDEAALDRFAEVGRRAWADVPDAGRWLRRLRGGS